jgi:lactobin A/cerein 7B family class IIb bacteriocin
MDKLESPDQPKLETQISGELTTDDLEQVNGGFVPLAIAGVGAAIFIGGVIKGAMDEEADERDRARGRH